MPLRVLECEIKRNILLQVFNVNMLYIKKTYTNLSAMSKIIKFMRENFK